MSQHWAHQALEDLLNAATAIFESEMSMIFNQQAVLMTFVLGIALVSIILGSLWYMRNMGRYGCCCCLFSCCEAACPGPPCQLIFVPVSFCFPCKSMRRCVSCSMVTSAEFWTFFAEISVFFFFQEILSSQLLSQFKIMRITRIGVFLVFAPPYLIYRAVLSLIFCLCGKCRHTKEDAPIVDENETAPQQLLVRRSRPGKKKIHRD